VAERARGGARTWRPSALAAELARDSAKKEEEREQSCGGWLTGAWGGSLRDCREQGGAWGGRMEEGGAGAGGGGAAAGGWR
jgi:hypothetical protein